MIVLPVFIMFLDEMIPDMPSPDDFSVPCHFLNPTACAISDKCGISTELEGTVPKNMSVLKRID
jgi:hypothetical protein